MYESFGRKIVFLLNERKKTFFFFFEIEISFFFANEQFEPECNRKLEIEQLSERVQNKKRPRGQNREKGEEKNMGQSDDKGPANPLSLYLALFFLSF